MRLQGKSLMSALPMGRGKSKPETEVSAGETNAPNLQSLAAELHQAALQGVFDYSKYWLLAARFVAGMFLIVSFLHAGVIIGNAVVQPGFGPMSLLSPEMAGAVLGLVLAAVASAFVLNLLPTLQVTPQGLGVSEMFGWRRVAWKDIGVLRVMELSGSGRYVVMIPFKKGARTGGPGPMLKLIPGLLGAAQKGERGVVVTSDMKNFDRLLQLIVSYLAQAAGQATPQIETLVDEEVTMPVAQLVFAPEAALVRLTRSSRQHEDFYGVTVADPEPKLVWSKIVPVQLLIALGPALVMLGDVLGRQSERPVMLIHLIWTVGLVVLGLAELPFVARMAQGVGDLMVGSGQYKRSVLAYLELQTPRAVLVFLAAAVVGAGMPAVIAQGLWLVGIALTTVLVTRYVQKLYYLPMTPALLATVATLIYQASLLALYMAVR
ncbi:MAG: hypothetical protein M3437_11090 [Chloroflexota bacterium]|nr:hypothetical protein [Chloroflexota bacterium]MDQ5866570.1 hypothetical protein [Chloroflexota bacterium]